MPTRTKTKTPDELRQQAAKLAEQAAAVQAELDAHTMREYEQEQTERAAADQRYVETFDAAALDQAVDQARAALDQTIADDPVTQALAGYLAAQYRRNHAHNDLASALGRLGRPNVGGRQSGTTELQSLDELIITAAQRTAQRMLDTFRQEQSR